MGKKIMSWKTKGMNRDLSVSAFNPEFAFENMNLRLSTVEGNTMLSWVSERGTLLMPCKEYDNIETDATISGAPIGTAVINHKLVLFTTPNTAVDYSSDHDRIYLITFNDDKDKLVIKKLYEGNLNFCTKNPIETLVSYESETIQKVYWTDGRNQPRMINIVGNIKPDVDGQFDFVLSVALNEDIFIEKTVGGVFDPGTIQYCFTYLNSYGQQTNIIKVTPLYYTTNVDRGVSPENKSNSKFNIYLYDLDTNFDYVRLYAISRSSLDGSVNVRLLEDLPMSNISNITINGEIKQGLKYVDIGTGGSSVDPYELFYLGGKEVTALTMSDKDNTLFLGNLNIINSDITPIQYYFDKQRLNSNSIITFRNGFISNYYLISVPLTDFIMTGSEGAYKYTLKDNPETVNGQNISLYLSNMPIGEQAYVSWTDNTTHFNRKSYVENNLGVISFETPIQISISDIFVIPKADDEGNTFLLDSAKDTFYDNTFTLNSNSYKIKTFKGGDTYRFGFQLQKKTGEWSEPIFIEDKNNTKYPRIAKYDGIYKGVTHLVYADAILNMQLFIDETINDEPNPYYIKDFDKIYKRVRPIVVYPDIAERHVLCQGVLNPTLFNSLDRKEKLPYAQPSWFYRPNTYKDWEGADTFVPYTIDRYNSNYDSAYMENLGNFSGLTTQVQAMSCWVDDDSISTIRQNMSISYTTLKQGGSYNVDDYEGPYYRAVILMAVIPLFSTGDPGIILPRFGTNTTGTFHPYVLVATPFSNFPKTYEQGGYVTYYGGQLIFEKNELDQQWYLANVSRNGIYHSFDYNISIFGSGGTIEFGEYSDYNPVPSSDNPDGTRSDFYLPAPVFTGTSDATTVDSDKMLVYVNRRVDIWPSQFDFKMFFYANGNTRSIERCVVVHLYCDQSSIRLEGSKVEFAHFKPLFYSADNSASKRNSYYKQIEVQGAEVGPYTNPYSNIISSYASSRVNTQFFVDSSIITMDSPDIEFNEEVVNQSMEGWKLRIVGAVPLTGGISSHFIERSSTPYYPGLAKEELPYNTRFNNFDVDRGFNGYKKLVSDYIWNDSWINARDGNNNAAEWGIQNHLVFPWQRNGSLNADPGTQNVATSWLKRKKLANLSYSFNTEYIQSENIIRFTKNTIAASNDVENDTHVENAISSNHSGMMYDFDNQEVSVQIHLHDDGKSLMRLDRQAIELSDINYYPNINKSLDNSKGFWVYSESNRAGDRSGIVSMKYKSGSHAVIAFKKNTDSNNSYFNNCIPILPFAFTEEENKRYVCGKYDNTIEDTDSHDGETFWGDVMHFKQEGIEMTNMFSYLRNNIQHSRFYDFLWLGELYRELDESNLFGGTGRNALLNNKWIVCGNTVDIPNQVDANNERKIHLKWTEGDTYYQRYDCLKTYPYTDDDQNQIVEILSFMCESHINLDGRYDNNRGQENNVNMTPEIFNLLNPNYTQHNNFFTQRKYSKDSYDTSKYLNMIWYSKTKTSGADVDLWTNIDLSSILELDGDKGELKSIQRFNNNLIAFQDKGISQILYNENVQISTENGVPVEIANSGKVQGKRYLSNTIGCSNKWSIANTPSGIYFMDSNNKGIYLFNGEIHNMSLEKGFDSWAKNNIPSGDVEWTPDGFDNFVTHYDPINQDILFINKELCLAYSEKFGVFTSFYNYQNSPYFCNIDDTSLWVKKTSEGNLRCQIYKHQAGDYCRFFGHNEPYSMTLIGNPEPQTDKIFTNLEFRACVDGEGRDVAVVIEDDQEVEKEIDATTPDNAKKRYKPFLPFDSIESWNEYQHGFTSFDSTTLRRKFRTWACNIPRDNVPSTEDQESSEPTLYTKDSALHITRFNPKAIDRMRNHWLYLKLKKNAATENNSLKKTEIHDISMTYFD